MLPQRPGRHLDQRPGTTVGAHRIASGATAGVREDQRGIRPAPHQAKHRDQLVLRYGSLPKGRLAVALDLGGDRVTQPEAARHDVLGHGLEPILEGRVEVAERFQQAQGQESWDR